MPVEIQGQHVPTEQEVVAHAKVVLYNAESSHATGYRVTFGLLDEKDYEDFSSITKRRKRKAGGRYEVWMLDSTGHVVRLIEGWFLGWSMTHSSGARIKFDITPEDFEFFRSLPAQGEGDHSVVAAAWTILLVELDDDDTAIDQVAREKVETLHGGERAQAAGRLGVNPDFQRFVAHRSGIDGRRANPEECAAFIRKHSKIDSRRELDTDPEAFDRFIKWVRKPFAIWMEGRP